MKFYNREREIAQLEKIEARSADSAQMTFVVGRRRMGKTALLTRTFADKPMVYFFVTRKNEALLCEEFIEEIQNRLGVTAYGSIKSFKDIFAWLMDLSATRRFTVIVDEFQEFRSVNVSIYSEMQRIWDMKKDSSRINLILCGSIYSIMKRIFENSKEPLFGRATARMHVKAFDMRTLKIILADHFPTATNDDLLAFYIFTGGIPKYVEILVEAKAFTREAILDEILSDNSYFIDEGRNVLIDEFGKEYGSYFSILTLIASSKTSRSEMESLLEMDLGGFLDRLENDFGLISKIRPVFAKPLSRNVKFRINDNFLSFWFCFIYKYRSAVEIGNFKYLREIIDRDYETFSGHLLERYFQTKIAADENLSLVGNYWETGNRNEIDIVGINEIEKRAVIAEVKRNKARINLNVLKDKAVNLTKHLAGYEIEYRGLSIEDM